MMKYLSASGLFLSVLLANAVIRQTLLKTVKYLTERRCLQCGHYHRASQYSVASKE